MKVFRQHYTGVGRGRMRIKQEILIIIIIIIIIIYRIYIALYPDAQSALQHFVGDFARLLI